METRTVGHLKSTTFFKSNSLRILTRSSSTYYNDILSHYLLFAFLMLFFFFFTSFIYKEIFFFSSSCLKKQNKKIKCSQFLKCSARRCAAWCPAKLLSHQAHFHRDYRPKKSIVLRVELLALEQKHHWCSKNKCGKSTKMSVIVKSTTATCIL